jgi:protein CLEC16A
LLYHLNNENYDELNCTLALSLFYTLINNPGIPSKIIQKLNSKYSKFSFIEVLINKSIEIINQSIHPNYKVRLATLEIAVKLVKKLIKIDHFRNSFDYYMACIEQAKEQSAYILRKKFKNEEMQIFLDIFEHEYDNINSLNIEFLLRDWSILLEPTSTPLSGIEFSRRYPCGETEKLKYSMRTFFILRDLCLNLSNEKDDKLPLTKQEALVKENDALDLNSSDLIACTVMSIENKKERRFLVIDPIQFILVEPEIKRIGWGIVKFSDLIQDVEVNADKEDSRSLIITIKRSPGLNEKPKIILKSIFTFDDHIRCMAAKQHLIRSRERARKIKLEKISQLLDMAPSKTYPNKTCNLNETLSYNLVASILNFFILILK